MVLGMKKGISRFTAALLAVTMLAGCGSTATVVEPTWKSPIEGLSEDFIFGMDASSVLVEEKSGVKYYSFDGQEQDVFKTFSEAGINYIRLRVWNDPYDENGNGYGGGNNDLPTAIELGKRATSYGMKVCIDFHYSDFWADPKRQHAPKAWEGMEVEEKSEALYEFTKDSLTQLLDAGVDVGMIQIGNEINYGMSGETKFDNVVTLLKSGSKAIREVSADYGKDIAIVVHYTRITSKADVLDLVSKLVDNELDFDMIGMSYYPFWDGGMDNMSRVLELIQERYGKKAFIAETSYAYTTKDGDGAGNSFKAGDEVKGYEASVEGQASIIHDICENVNKVGGQGVFYWEGAWIPVGSASANNSSIWEEYGSGWASSYASDYDPEDAAIYYGGCSWDNQAFFDFDGHPLESLNVYKYMRSSSAGSAKKVSITDFDEYVNGQWVKEQKAQNEASGGKKMQVLAWDAIYEQELEDLKVILGETDLSELSEEDRFYKAATFYRQMLDTSDMEKRAEAVKKHLEPIAQAKSFEDLYKLYSDKEYDLYNYVLNFTVNADEYGYNPPGFSPKRINEFLSREEVIRDYAACLGYSKEYCTTLIANAKIIDGLVEEYYNSVSQQPGAYYLEQKDFDEKGETVPVLEILGSLESLNRYKFIRVKGDFFGFLDKVFKEENVEALRDYYLLGAMLSLAPVYVPEDIWTKYGDDYQEVSLQVVLGVCGDAVNGKYRELNLTEENLQCAEEMAEDVKNVLREIIGEADWLTPHGKELVKHKVFNTHESYGENVSQNDLASVKLTDDVVENYIALLTCRKDFFRSQIKKEDDKRVIFNNPLFYANALFTKQYMDLYISCNLMTNPLCSKEVSYEERLAFLGSVMAHEMAHNYDPEGMSYDYHGYMDDWLTEEEWAAYNAMVQDLVDFFDGKEIAEGVTIDGKLVACEAFADIMSVRCCLKLLEKQENPDYDLFFRTYAKQNAAYYTEEGLKIAAQDTHLTAKERTNYVLAQFDKFYETYDVDENSPYYVKEEERLKIF